MEEQTANRFCGRTFGAKEISEIREVVESCSGLSRRELASTVCEIWEWKRANGALKTRECVSFLEKLETEGLLRLLGRKHGRPKGSKTRVGRTSKGEQRPRVAGDVSQYKPIELKPVKSKAERDLWYEYVHRHHSLEYQMPYGAQLRYFIASARCCNQVLGCVQFSSAAWKMAPRDRWIGWDETHRRRNLQKVVSQSRFLVLPWIEIKNLASAVLGLSARRIARDWKNQYGYRPVLLESLVEEGRFQGTCYKAANWINVGTTTGRGRMDRENRKDGRVPKKIYLYPLHSRFREELLAA